MTYDFYDLLGVPEDASQEDIKEAFRSRVQEVHPDLNDDPRAPAQFTALKKGYDTLNDPVERKAYDRLGHKNYVAKRLEGLPDPDQWNPTDSGSGGTEVAASGPSSTASAGAGKSTGSAGTGRTTTARAGGTDTASGTNSGAASGSSTTGTTGASTGTSNDASTSTRTRTNTRTNTGSATGTTGASTRTGRSAASETKTGSATGTAGGTGGATSADGPGLVERLRSFNYGWPLVFLTAFVYVAGIGLYAREHVDALQEFAAQVGASGADVSALRSALLTGEYGFTSMSGFVRSSALVEGRPGAGILIAAGAVLMPLVIFVVVRTTRKAFAWQPTYLYVVAVLAPAVGLVANVAGVDSPVLTVVAFGVLPLCAVVALPFNAFVTPRLKRLF
ncbi:DnaJ domain-containing protein [Halostella sp. PRR32]|uniref:J domain-containing protein n=1 Tax=Halostella sp. PRR32 TaxID=3098147 RepID=UPI002B1DEAFF|nr:DnaJ domain-containing protein [Halostella sp. PRR32]